MKQFYSISEVSKIVGVNNHTLRYWETKFKVLKPDKSGSKRIYSLEQLEIVKLIKKLLYDEGYTIKGAVNVLKTKSDVEQLKLQFKEEIDNTYIIKRLKSIINILKSKE